MVFVVIFTSCLFVAIVSKSVVLLPKKNESRFLWYHNGTRKNSKTCVKRPLKIDKIKVLMTTGSLTKVESIAECSLCNTFDLH